MGSRGPKPNPPLTEYVECVETLHDTNPETGVPVDAVAVTVGVARSTASKRLAELEADGKLDREKEWPTTGRPRWYYKPSSSEG